MSKERTAFETEKRYRDVTLRMVRHQSLQDMRDEIVENYLPDTIGKPFVPISDDIDLVHAITLGQYINKDPEITVFCPMMSDALLAIAIPHEALHVTFAIIRHELANSISNDVAVNVNGPLSDCHSVAEELICTIAGEVTAELKSMLAFIEEHVAAQEAEG